VTRRARATPVDPEVLELSDGGVLLILPEDSWDSGWRCGAVTTKGQRCSLSPRGTYRYGREPWARVHAVYGDELREAAQLRCNVHVDHSQPAPPNVWVMSIAGLAEMQDDVDAMQTALRQGWDLVRQSRLRVVEG
jgi:hypothetical protein